MASKIVIRSDKECGLLSLDTDSLLSILINVDAKDHESLRLSCSVLQKTIDSKVFRVHRGDKVQVVVTLDDMTEDVEDDDDDSYAEKYKEEHYDELGYRDDCFGYHDIRATVWFDRKVGGSAVLTLLPRDDGEWFSMTDSISQEMQEVGVLFCDDEGRPRPRCIKKCGKEGKRGGFLYINEFSLNKDLIEDYPNAGPMALRSLLCSTKLKGKWTLAVYIAESEAHYDKDDKEKSHRMKYLDMGGDDFELSADLREWIDVRLKGLARYDMRQFFQCGFQQVDDREIVQSSNCYYMFAFPSFFKPSIISLDKALLIPIADKNERPKPSPPKGVNKQLLELCKQMCLHREKEPTNKTTIWHDISFGQVAKANDEFDNVARASVKRLIEEVGATVEGSNALHCCAAIGSAKDVSLMMEFVPPKEREKVINGLDQTLNTPLMLAAEEGSARSYDVCKRLIELGADKSIENQLGYTAFGVFLNCYMGRKDFRTCFGAPMMSGEQQLVDRSLRALLLPENDGSDLDKILLRDVRKLYG